MAYSRGSILRLSTTRLVILWPAMAILRSDLGNHWGTTANQIHGTMRKHHKLGSAYRNGILEAQGMSMKPSELGDR
jgi:hypothetical protein